MHKVGRPWNAEKTCNAFLVIKRLKATHRKACLQAQPKVPRETLEATSLYHLRSE